MLPGPDLAGQPLGPGEIAAFLERLSAPALGVGRADSVARIGLLERVKGAASAAQARLAVGLADAQVAADGPREIDPVHTARSVGAEVALVRKESPHQGARFVRLAHLLSADMPATMAALTAGDITEHRASVVVSATSFLSSADRRRLDSEIASRLGELSDRSAQAVAAGIAYRLDPRAAVAHTGAAESARRVTFRPAPDTMAILSALVPAAAGVAMFAALDGVANSAKGSGDLRSRGQIMADTLFARVTGRESVTDVPLQISLVMSDETLLAAGPVPGRIEGYGPVPAPTARRMADGSTETARRWLRRIYTRAGAVVAMDQRARAFTGNLRDLVILRDQVCRTPYCGAPIRHLDHVVAHRDDGPTSITNGQGLCAGCNYLKEHPDWSTTAVDDGLAGSPHATRITTPSGQTYDSTAPPLLPGKSAIANSRLTTPAEPP